jgi:hypothetical protein
MALPDLCESIVPGPVASSKITEIYLRMNKGILHHEYLTVHLAHPNGEDFWIRLERAGDTTRHAFKNRTSSISKYPPLDNAQAARTEDLLIREENTVKSKLRFPHDTGLTLYILRQLLFAFIKEAPEYSLMWENCRYFCSVVLELLAEQYPCEGGRIYAESRTNTVGKQGTESERSLGNGLPYERRDIGDFAVITFLVYSLSSLFEKSGVLSRYVHICNTIKLLVERAFGEVG